jgi:hypothetical protein
MPAVFNTVHEAKNSLVAQGFMANNDEYLELCAVMLVFLCNTSRFEAALASVSALMWSHYSGLDPTTRNKFSRSLAHVAVQNKFRVSTHPCQAPHPDLLQTPPASSPGPMDIKLVGSYGDFFGLLRDQMFWKDSMDMEHGEYSHALQWLALASEFGPRAATFYSKLPDYQSSARTGRIPLWSYLADCFPDTKKADPELTSNTYRSPQIITKHLLGRSTPIRSHFVSFYLTYVYKQRKLVSYDQTKFDNTIKANYGSASSYALDKPRADKWTSVTETTKGSKPQVTRLNRDALADPGRATKQQVLEVDFHAIKGKFWTKGDWGNLTFD